MGGANRKPLCVMANKYHETIWVKYDVDKKNVTMKEYTVKVGVSELCVGGGLSVKKQYDWERIKSDFTPILSGELLDRVVDCKDSNIMYITIIGENDEILCSTVGHIDTHLLVTEKGLLRAAHPKNPWEEHPKYERLYQNRPKIPDLSATKPISKNIKHKDDEKECSIWGKDVTASGTLLLADYFNKNIKSVSPDGKVISKFTLPSRPRAITVVDTNTAAVAANDKKLYILNITDPTTLSIRREYQLEYDIYAITTYDKNLIVSCQTDPWCIKMITIDNVEVWTTSKDQLGRALFASAAGISTTTKDNGETFIVVADRLKSSLIQLEADTGDFYRTIVMEGQEPRSITKDEYGNIYVCQYRTGQICVCSSDFKESKILLSGIEGPNRIAYSGVNKNLCISHVDSDLIDYIQLRTNDDRVKTVEDEEHTERMPPTQTHKGRSTVADLKPPGTRGRSISPGRNVLPLKATKSGSLSIKNRDDRKDCFILGLAVYRNGTLFLTDKNNKNIKSVSPDGKDQSVSAIPASPSTFTVLDSSTAVAAGEDKKLYILDIKDPKTLSVRPEPCKLPFNIFAMTNYNENLLVTCDTKPSSLKMITTTAVELWSVDKTKSGENLFDYPNGIATTTIDGKAVIVVADSRKHTLTRLEADTGKFIKAINVGEKKPWGMTVDNAGNVYVCYHAKREICVWSNDFTKSKILLSANDLDLGPFYVVYNDVNNSIYISYSTSSRRGNTIDCFRLN